MCGGDNGEYELRYPASNFGALHVPRVAEGSEQTREEGAFVRVWQVCLGARDCWRSYSALPYGVLAMGFAQPNQDTRLGDCRVAEILPYCLAPLESPTRARTHTRIHFSTIDLLHMINTHNPVSYTHLRAHET